MSHYIKVPAPRSHGKLFTDLLDAVRFWTKVELQSPQHCWPFTGSLDSSGHGLFRYGRGLWMAHRAAYADSQGPIPEGARIVHACGNPACCNPRHLKMLPRRGEVAAEVGDTFATPATPASLRGEARRRPAVAPTAAYP